MTIRKAVETDNFHLPAGLHLLRLPCSFKVDILMRVIYFLLPALLLLILGCSGDQSTHSSGSAHVHQALKGGKLLELGQHGSGYNLELVLNENGLLELYILDAHAENYVRIKQPTIELFLADYNASAPNPLVLHAIEDSATGETVGNTALFRSLQDVNDRLPIAGILKYVEIGSKTYTNQAIEFSGNP
jgi:hypothetical protein